MQIFLIRHPRPLIDAGVCYGQLDIDCADAQHVAARLRALLPEGTPIISSPLRRAWQRAAALYPPARLQQRAIDFAASLAGSRVALVTHAGVMRALVGHWHQLPLAEWTQLKFEFGSITEIRI